MYKIKAGAQNEGLDLGHFRLVQWRAEVYPDGIDYASRLKSPLAPGL